MAHGPCSSRCIPSTEAVVCCVSCQSHHLVKKLIKQTIMYSPMSAVPLKQSIFLLQSSCDPFINRDSQSELAESSAAGLLIAASIDIGPACLVSGSHHRALAFSAIL